MKNASYLWYKEIRVNVFIFSPTGRVGALLNRKRLSRRPPYWVFIRNILFMLPLGAEWMEWHSVHMNAN